MEKYLTGDGLLKAALVFLALAWSWNLIYTALANARKEKERADAPLNIVRADINKLQNEINTDRGRIEALERVGDAHERELKDLHTGQTELCRGVQALLEHALHNGNNDEMQAASASIGKWLRNR